MPFKSLTSQQNKKKPPPRPPPPNFNKLKSKSTHNITKQFETPNLIDWSPPNSPRAEKLENNRPFGGSVSSSFSSSTSSLASTPSSKYEASSGTIPLNVFWGASYGTQTSNTPLNIQGSTNSSNTNTQSTNLFGPTIIRPQAKKVKNKAPPPVPFGLSSPPMPCMPPPSPPKDAGEVITPYGVVLFDFPASQPEDLPLEVDDVVILIRRINDEWLYGQVGDKEGMFPQNFINIIVPLTETS